MRVTTADFVKNFGQMADKALTEPVTITKHGRDRLVMVSATEYERLKRRDRQAMRSEDLPEQVLASIAEADVADTYAHLDDELPEDWKP